MREKNPSTLLWGEKNLQIEKSSCKKAYDSEGSHSQGKGGNKYEEIHKSTKCQKGHKTPSEVESALRFLTLRRQSARKTSARQKNEKQEKKAKVTPGKPLDVIHPFQGLCEEKHKQK